VLAKFHLRINLIKLCVFEIGLTSFPVLISEGRVRLVEHSTHLIYFFFLYKDPVRVLQRTVCNQRPIS
jgi:hypothetical protein